MSKNRYIKRARRLLGTIKKALSNANKNPIIRIKAIYQKKQKRLPCGKRFNLIFKFGLN